MPRAKHPCTRCGTPTAGAGQCATCRRLTDAARGNRHQRGYDKQHDDDFRTAVLDKHKRCRCDLSCHHHAGGVCTARATHADHWPRDRRELVRLGLDPNDPRYGRGLCRRCHNRATAMAQPGGWNAPT